MKKFSLIAVVLLLAAPAWAVVDITCECEGDQITVSYDAGTDTVRAFALDITVTAGTITAVDPTVTYDPNYNIYPGSISIVDGEVNDLGTPVGDPNDHVDTKPGLGYSAITIEMGSLYAPPDDANGPPSSGELIKLTISDTGASIIIEENEARGGVVLTNGTAPGINAPGCACECFPAGHPDYDEWLYKAGKPSCWCNTRQCHGDVDGLEQQVGKGWFWVSENDLIILADAYGKVYSTDPNWSTWICADVDHKEQQVGKGWFRVSENDLIILAGYYGSSSIDPNCLDY